MSTAIKNNKKMNSPLDMEIALELMYAERLKKMLIQDEERAAAHRRKTENRFSFLNTIVFFFYAGAVSLIAFIAFKVFEAALYLLNHGLVAQL